MNKVVNLSWKPNSGLWCIGFGGLVSRCNWSRIDSIFFQFKTLLVMNISYGVSST